MLFDRGPHDEKICIEWYLDAKGKPKSGFGFQASSRKYFLFARNLEPEALNLFSTGIRIPFQGADNSSRPWEGAEEEVELRRPVPAALYFR